MQRWLRQYRQEVKGITTPAALAITPDEVMKDIAALYKYAY